MTKNLLKQIQVAKDRIKNSDVIKKLFKEYDIDINEIDLVPVCFKDLDVSARTSHGCIYLNTNLIDTDFTHYLVHELSHIAQQTTGSKPTKGSNDDDYLDNKDEQEGFQNQTEYIAEEHGARAAEKYIEKVLDHHNVEEDEERAEKKKKLLKRKAQLIKLMGA